MRILYVIPCLACAGAEVLVTKIAILAKKNGHVVKILVFKDVKNHLTSNLSANGVEIICNPKNKIYSPFNAWFLLVYLMRNEFDVIHAHLTQAQLCLAFASVFINKRTPLITTEHSTHNRRRKLFFRFLDYFIYSRFDSIVSISDEVQKELIKWVPFVTRRCQIIDNGVDIMEFVGVESREKLSVDNLSVLCVGNFRVPKDHETLIRAFALTKGMELFLVGEGELRESLEILVKRLGLENRVHFLGIRHDIPALVRGADIYVQPSLWEGFCIAVAEAMAGGLPVVVSDAPALLSLVSKNGLIFPTRDTKGLAKCLMLLALDKKLRKRLSALGLKRIQDFDLGKTFERYIGLYKGLSKRRGIN